jgi:hypothetical protein
VIKPGAIIGIGTVILVIGLSGLGLLQTGVIHPTEVKSPEPATGQQSEGPMNQTAPAAAPAPQSGVEPGAQTGANLAGSALQGRQPPSGDLAAEEPVPVPEAGKGESGYPKQDRLGHPQSSPVQIQRELSQDAKTTREPKCDEKRSKAHLKSESERYARRTPPAHSAQPLVIRFNFDPARDRGLNVAQVHSGDKIRVKWRRVGQVDRRVYFTFSKNINSPKGAVLKLKTRRSFDRPVMYRTDRGYYVIEVKIYPGNRWNIKPRRFV